MTAWPERNQGKPGEKAEKIKDRKTGNPAQTKGLSKTDKWCISFGFASAPLLTSTSLSFHVHASDYQEFSHRGAGFKCWKQRKALWVQTPLDYQIYGCAEIERQQEYIPLSPDTSDLFSDTENEKDKKNWEVLQISKGMNNFLVCAHTP